MPYPEKNPLTVKAQFYLATLAGDAYKHIEASTRPGHKTGKNDDRYSREESKHRRHAIAEFIGNIRPGLVCLAHDWAYDPRLKKQIESDTDPIVFHSADKDVDINSYADMLAVTARAIDRNTEGRFGSVVLKGAADSSTADITLQYKIASAPRGE